MSRKVVQREGQQWVEKNIISNDQYEQILQLYDEKRTITSVLPLLASLLVGLGILTFIASNWSDIVPLGRLLILVACTLGFYIAGERTYTNGSRSLGIALICLGVVSFGASIFLIGQTFHYVAYDASPFILWAIPALLLSYAYSSRYLFLIAFAILMSGQLYSFLSLAQLSIILSSMYVIGLGLIWFRFKNALLSWFIAIGFLMQMYLLIAYYDISFMWILPIMLFMYTVASTYRMQRWLQPLQYVMQISAFSIAVFFVYSLSVFYDGHLGQSALSELPTLSFFLPVWGVLFLFCMYMTYQFGDRKSWYEWLLFLPLVYIWPGGDFAYLLMLFLFAGLKLWYAFEAGDKRQINIAVTLFLLTTFLAYLHIAWDFMPKSLLFLLGGLVLFTLNFIIQKKKKQILREKRDR